jgi:hypothetical protein
LSMKAEHQTKEDIDTDNAMRMADECSKYIIAVYTSARALDLGYEFLVSTIPSITDPEAFQYMLDLAGKVPEEYKETAEHVRQALQILREIHKTHPEVEMRSMTNLECETLGLDNQSEDSEERRIY